MIRDARPWPFGHSFPRRPRPGSWILDTARRHGRCVASIRPVCSRRFAPVRAETKNSRYMLRVADEVGMKTTIHDPYAFPHLLTEYDMYLLNEGRHWQSYNRLGAHLRAIDDVEGVNFCLWAHQRHGREHRRRLQSLGRPPAPDAKAHPQRLLGAVRPEQDQP